MNEEKDSLNFLEQIIEEDLSKDYTSSDLCFRFPPEPNGYLHIGHLKAIAINFNLGNRYQAPVNLRFDDTNPVKENQVYVDAIKTTFHGSVSNGKMSVMPRIIFNNYLTGLYIL